MIKLTAIIPTFNEESYIEDAIKSVNFADEVIIIDSFSTDSTKEKALALGCSVLERKFDNFSEQKNYAIPYATGDWILFMDADERVTEKLRYEILEAISSNTHTGYKIRFVHFYMNRFLYHKIDTVLRLAKNENLKFTGSVHEKLEINGTVGKLKNYMLHFTYKGFFHLLKKKDSYAWFQANESIRKGKKATYFHLLFKPAYRFFHTYFIKRGFLDGIPGLALASINAYGVLSRYAKMMLIQRGLK